MAYYLLVPPTTAAKRVQLLSDITQTASGNFEIEFEVDILGTNGIVAAANVSNSQNLIFFTTLTNLQFRIANSQHNFTLPQSAAGRHVYRIVSNTTAGNIQVFQDGVSCGTITGNTFWSVGRIADLNAQTSRHFGLYYLKVRNESDTLIHHYDPSASNGTGLTLIDTVSGNNGTLENFPTDNSQWVFYEDGGGTPEFTATISSTTLLPTSSVTIANLKPEYAATISSSTLLPSGIVALESIAPIYNVTITSSTLLPTSSVTITNIKPEFVLSVNSSTPIPSSTVVLTSFGAGDYVTTISSSALLPTSVVELDTLAPVGISVTSNAPLPFSEVTLDYENYSISVSSNTLLPSGIAELDSTIPEYSADITSSTKLPTSIVFLVNGEVIKNINPRNIIKVQYRSNTVSAKQPNNITTSSHDNIIKLRN